MMKTGKYRSVIMQVVLLVAVVVLAAVAGDRLQVLLDHLQDLGVGEQTVVVAGPQHLFPPRLAHLHHFEVGCADLLDDLLLDAFGDAFLLGGDGPAGLQNEGVGEGVVLQPRLLGGLRLAQVLSLGSVVFAEGSAGLLALLLFLHVDALELLRELVADMFVGRILRIVLQRREVVLAAAVAHFQRLLEVVAYIFEGGPLVGQVVQHLPHQIGEFHLVEGLHLLQVDVDPGGVVPAPAVVRQIHQQRHFQDAEPKHVHIRFEDIHLVMAVQYFWGVESVVGDGEGVFGDGAGVEQAYPAAVDEDLVAAQHSVADVEFGEVLEGARD